MLSTFQPLQLLSLSTNNTHNKSYEKYERLVCGYIREWEFFNNNTSNNNSTSISHGIPHEIIELIYIFYPKYYESILSSKYCGSDVKLSEDFLTAHTSDTGKGIVRCTHSLINGMINIWYVTLRHTQCLNYSTSLGIISHSTPVACYSNVDKTYHPYFDLYENMNSGALFFGLGIEKDENSWTADTKCHNSNDANGCFWYQPEIARGHTIKVVCDLRKNRNCLSFYFLTDKSYRNIDEDNDEHQNIKRIGLPATYSKKNACKHDLKFKSDVEIGDEIMKEESENDLIVDYTFKLPNDRQYIWYPCLAPWLAGLTISFDNTEPKNAETLLVNFQCFIL